jgi:dodecin
LLYAPDRPEELRRSGGLKADLEIGDTPEGLASPFGWYARRKRSERGFEKGVTQENTSVARVTEISAVSEEGFEDAIRQAIGRATKTLRNVEGAWVKDQNVMIEDGNIVGYKVNLEVTFVLEDNV